MKIIKRDNNERYVRPLSVWDDFFGFPTFSDELLTPSHFKNVSADLWDDENNVYIKMAMPGIKSEDVNVEVNEDVITISGNTKSEEKDETKNRYYFKSMESSYEQSFRLPCKVDTDKADAKYEAGVVTITLPKDKEQKKKVIKVN